MDFEDMLGLDTEDMMEIEPMDLMTDGMMSDETNELNIDEIIQQCKEGLFHDISEGGSVKCYEVSSEYVLVLRPVEKAETAKRLKNISGELRYMGLNVHTVVDYRTDGEYCYELQSRAKGERFKQRMLEDDLIKAIKSTQEFLDKGTSNEIEQSRAKLHMEGNKRMLANNPIKSRKDEYIRRCSMLMQMPKEHIVQYFDTIVSLSRFYRLGVDTVGEGNLLYDSETGFNFIDVNFFEKPHRHVSMENLLDIDNSDTMTELLGMEYIDDIDETDKLIVLSSIKDALKKIVTSVISSKICGEKLATEVIESGLESYRKYGINITLEEIIAENQKGENSVLQSGVEATTDVTRTGQINQQINQIKEQYRSKEEKQTQLE